MSNTASKYKINTNEQPLCEGFLFHTQYAPDAIALHINNKSYSYKEIYDIAFPIYCELQKQQQEKIGVYCTSDVNSYANILAVAMAGSCYVPLNSKYPKTKLQLIIDDCELKLILCANKNSEAMQLKRCSIIDTTPLLYKLPEHVDKVQPIQQKTAYILYTSGTTGMPKGVPVKKSNVNAFFTFFLNAYDFNPSDRFLQPYELSFDVSVFSVFCAWNAGASVYVVKDSNIKYLEIFKTIQDHKITVSSMVPGVLKLAAPFFKDFSFPHLRFSFFSGDTLYHTDAKKWKQCIPDGVIHNFYGPTETTIVCTRYCWNEQQSETESGNGIVPLGKAFPGMEYLLLDENNVVSNTSGELCFSGTQVIDGYVNNYSTESFFEHNENVYYKTGDWASVTANGNLLFHGRKDSQVKINGYRIELHEIENAITSLTGHLCKTITQELNNLNVLTAFIEGTSLTERELREQLPAFLPAYMLPSKFIFMETFPKNINGKTDVNELKKSMYAR